MGAVGSLVGSELGMKVGSLVGAVGSLVGSELGRAINEKGFIVVAKV